MRDENVQDQARDPPSTARHVRRDLIPHPVPLPHGSGDPRLVRSGNGADRAAQPGSAQTSTQAAPVSSAIRAGAIRTELWVLPAAGTTSSNARSETSQ
ncbi:hypothetical protein SAMN04488144_103259 [Methylobacterium sp. 190mf]|nr:hypothetical protein SAMN04488144_103259 [Methylobacterium sp. 190mf]